MTTYDESIFSDETKPITSATDILELTPMNYADLPPGEFLYLKSKATQTTDVKSPGQLKRRIAEFVHIQSIQMIPMRVGTLNRRFGRMAKRLGTGTMEVVNELLHTGTFTRFERGGNVGIYSNVVYEKLLAMGAEPSVLIPRLMSHIDGINLEE